MEIKSIQKGPFFDDEIVYKNALIESVEYDKDRRFYTVQFRCRAIIRDETFILNEKIEWEIK